MSIVDISGTVEWRVRRSASGHLIADCESLSLTLQADTQEELASLIGEAQHVLFMDLAEDGEFDEFLRRRGWRVLQPVPERPSESGVVFRADYNLVNANATHAPT